MASYKITQKILWGFHFEVDGLHYNFEVPANSQVEASTKLLDHLETISGEIENNPQGV